MEPTRDPEGVETAQLAQLECIHDRKVLEIGCGDGRMLWRYAPFAGVIAGVDPDPERLADVAGARPAGLETPVLAAEARAEMLPFADRAFNCAIFAWSL